MSDIVKGGIKYIPGKTYWVAGARNAWDTVVVGLYNSKEEVERDWPNYPKCAREATQLEVNNFFKLDKN